MFIMKVNAAFQLEVYEIKDAIFFLYKLTELQFLSTDPLGVPGPQFESPALEGAVFKLRVNA